GRAVFQMIGHGGNRVARATPRECRDDRIAEVRTGVELFADVRAAGGPARLDVRCRFPAVVSDARCHTICGNERGLKTAALVRMYGIATRGGEECQSEKYW